MNDRIWKIAVPAPSPLGRARAVFHSLGPSGECQLSREGAVTTTHCDDYIDDPSQPECLRAFLDHARSPAHGSFRPEPRPTLFADYQGRRVRVVIASRLGDVGITSNLAVERGYEHGRKLRRQGAAS